MRPHIQKALTYMSALIYKIIKRKQLLPLKYKTF